MDKVVLDKDYKPSEKEQYMSANQLEYFRQKLLKMKDELLDNAEGTLANLSISTEETYGSAGDEVDRANDEALKQLELRTRDRERKVISKIDEALDRIAKGEYGYSEISGDPIGLKRLEARPVATMTLEEQEEHESMEKLYK